MVGSTKIRQQWVRAVVFINAAVIGVLMAAMFVLVVFNVVSRYGFGVSHSWTEELARFMMIAVAYLGAGLALRQGRLVAIDIMQGFFPRAAKAMRLLIALIISVFLICIVYLGLQFAEFAKFQRTPVMGVSSYYPYLILPVGAGLTLLHLLIFLPGFSNSAWDRAIGDAHDGDDQQ